MLDYATIRKHFEKTAVSYEKADFLSKAIGDHLLERLSIIRHQPRMILEHGVQTGHLSQRLLSQYPYATLIPLEISECVLAQLPAAAQSHALALNSHYEALALRDGVADLVVSVFSLNWTNDISACLREVCRVLKSDSLVMFAILGINTLEELRESFPCCQHYFHTFPELHDIGDLLLQSGLIDPVVDTETRVMHYKTIPDIFSDIKLTGMSNAQTQRPRGLFGKNRWKQAVSRYESLRNSDSTYPITIETIYAYARTPNNIRRKETVIPTSNIEHRPPTTENTCSNTQ